MKKIIITLFALAMMLPINAQMTPEAVMGMTPDLPTTAALLNYWKERNDPLRDEAPDSYILDEFREAWNAANNQIQDMQGRLSGMGLSQSDFAKLQSSNLSDEEAKAMASKVMAKQIGGLTAKDIEAMSHMTDEQRAAFMQESGLGDSMTAKMNADKGGARILPEAVSAGYGIDFSWSKGA